MGKNRFVNRINDFHRLKTKITKANLSGKSSGILIYSRSGVGKSRFIDEFFKNEFNNYTKLKVRARVIPGQITDNLYFAKMLYNEILTLSNRKKNINIPQKNTFSSEPSLGISLGPLSISNIFFKSKNFYNSDIFVLTDNLKKIFQNKENMFLIHFENFNAIDPASYEIFLEVFRKSENNYFVFEYTTINDEDMRKIYSIKEDISNFINIDLYQLDIMDICEVQKICSDLNINFEVAKKIYEFPEKKGDLVSIVMLKEGIQPNNKSVNKLYKIEEVSDDELFLLFLIYLNKSTIKRSELLRIITCKCNNLYELTQYKFAPSQITSFLDSLIKKDFLEIKEDTLFISYTNILKVLGMKNNHPLFFIAYAILSSYYKQMLNDLYNREKAVIHLLHIYATKLDSDVIHILPYIKKIILLQKFPEAIVEKTNLILNEVIKFQSDVSIQKKITLEMIDLLFSIGDAKTGMILLKKIYTPKEPILVAYRAALIVSDVHSEFIEVILQNMITMFSKNTYLYLFINICLLTYYMRTQSGAWSQSFAKRIVTEFRGNITIEYALLLKLYSEFFNNNNALKILNKCIKIFSLNKREDLSSLCKITIASRFAYLGNTKKSFHILCEVEKFVRIHDIPMRKYYFMNNFAALSIINKNFTKDVEQMLQYALLLVTDEYEKIIILSNILIYYVNTNNKIMCENILDKLESMTISAYRYEELRHIYHYNLYYAYRYTENNNHTEFHKRKLFNMLNEKDSSQEIKDYIYASLTGKILPQDHQWHFYSTLEYRPDFIGYWQFELPVHN